MRNIIVAIILAWIAGWFSHAYFIRIDSGVDGHGRDTLTAIPTSVQPSAKPSVHKRNVNITTAGAHPHGRLQLFQKLLMRNHFAAALAAWPDADKNQARNMILGHSNDLKRAHKAETAIRLLNKYYHLFPEDTEAGLLYANILHQLQHFHAETFLLMGMLYKTADPGLLKNIKKRLRNAINAYTQPMMRSGSYRDLLNYYRQLSNLDGSNPNYQLKQVSILIDMGMLQQASAILQPLLFDPDVSHQTEALSEKINRVSSAHYQTSIPMERSGENFLVPVSINGNPPIQLLLDTGASITLIQRRESAINDEHYQRITLQTANGRIQVPLMEASEVTIGGYRLFSIKMGIVFKPVSAHAKGLLGMNILKHFNFFIDQKTPALKLTRMIHESP